MSFPRSKAAVFSGLGLLLFVAGCSPREQPSATAPQTNAVHSARVLPVARPVTKKAVATKGQPALLPAEQAKVPTLTQNESTNTIPDQDRPRSVLAAMNAIRRATTEADRRRAVTAFINNASFMANNPASVEVLLDTLKLTPEHDVLMAVQQVLGQAPDTAVPFMAALLYHDATTPDERERLLGVIRQTQTPAAVSMLTGLADTAAGHYADPLALAAVDTLGVIGTPAAVRDLMSRIETAAAQGQSVQTLVEALSRTLNPAAYELLLATAQGTGTANAQARLAAMNALGNYPTAVARAALNQIIAQETDADLLATAKKALKRANLDLPDDFGKAQAP